MILQEALCSVLLVILSELLKDFVDFEKHFVIVRYLLCLSLCGHTHTQTNTQRAWIQKQEDPDLKGREKNASGSW